MDLKAYENNAVRTAVYPDKGTMMGLVYCILGLSGESGEVAEKLKKLIRDQGSEMTPEFKEAVAKELGDVLWYVTNAAVELGLSLEYVAQKNNEKLLARLEAGTLKGNGDDR